MELYFTVNFHTTTEIDLEVTISLINKQYSSQVAEALSNPELCVSVISSLAPLIRIIAKQNAVQSNPKFEPIKPID